jgi:hypothetical protein
MLGMSCFQKKQEIKKIELAPVSPAFPISLTSLSQGGQNPQKWFKPQRRKNRNNW